MRKSFFIFLLLGGLALGVGVFNSLLNTGEIKPAIYASTAASAKETGYILEKPESSAISDPVGFSIPSLNIENIMIESVGLDKESKMDIPKNEDNVAWYNLGAKPGEKGNAVIAGHFDKKTGEPAVFYEINKLQKGDEIKVKDKEGKEYAYAVTEVVSYELAEFPLDEVFGAGDNARLNLITCEGTYDKTSKLYSHRLVVYSELKSDQIK